MKFLMTLVLSLFSLHSIAAHYEANNCEIFIDKIKTNSGSHGYHGLTFYLKTLNSHLDSEIEEVGFRSKTVDNSSNESRDWNNKILIPFYNAKDYWTFNLNISHDWGYLTHEGSFYVKTKNGTYYWAKPTRAPEQTENFMFDSNTYYNILREMRPGTEYSSTDSDAVATQIPTMKYYNPKSCY
jgi:hypothetical protein